jgi:prominin 1
LSGYRKDAYPEERSGTATCGGNFLMAATGFMFIFSWILMLFCVVWFALGIDLHIVCRETKGDKLSESMDYFLAGKLKIDGHEIKLSEVVASCEKDEPLYKAIGGENIYNVSAAINISQYTSSFDVAGIAEKIDLTDQKILSDDINKTLADLDISKATQSYDADIQQVNDFDIATELKNISTLVKKLQNAGQTDLANQLDAIRIDLDNMVKSNVSTLKTKIGTDLKKELSGVSELATGFKLFADDVLVDALRSESFIQNDLKVIVGEEIRALSLKIVGWFTQLIAHLTVQLATTMWKCSPLTKLYGGVHAYFCDNLIQNLNGFWMALGWCLLFFVPAIIFAVKLAKYYRKMKNKDEEDGEHYAYNPDYDTAPRGEATQMKDPRGSPLFKNSIGPANL